MGYAFTYPLAALAGSTVGSYTHYPTLRADMVRDACALDCVARLLWDAHICLTHSSSFLVDAQGELART